MCVAEANVLYRRVAAVAQMKKPLRLRASVMSARLAEDSLSGNPPVCVKARANLTPTSLSVFILPIL